MGIVDKETAATVPPAPTDMRTDNEFTQHKKPDGSTVDEAQGTGATSNVRYNGQDPSNGLNKSPESQKPDNGSQYSSNGSQMSTQPNKPSNGKHYPSNERNSNEAKKPHNGIQSPSDDPNMLTNPKKPRNGSETSDGSNKQNNQQHPTVTTSEMNPKTATAVETPDLAQSKQTNGNKSSAGADDTEPPGSNECCCCSIL
ncbi:hypothetical protein Nepgr_009626 [Nepenthes gracilis]|uniref:Uncharacterized protein n=1 Tax=Nepenthes gracilis TaxID=150966 RepID=A0AAD3XKK6_NEPGR|nr:hypothetical protein Nepgr_009626 [Nepenthes gracilis]